MEPQGGRYLVDGRAMATADAHFGELVAQAYVRRSRPACLCRQPPIEVYLARLASGVVVKRMPGSGHLHAAGCPHHESPEDAEALAPLVGTAIQEDLDAGTTVLRLDFALSSRPGSAQPPPASRASDEVRDPGRRLSLGALLRYLWSEAGLNQWREEWAGRRSWGTVRRRLLTAADGKLAGGRPLLATLLIPEPFSSERRDEIDARYVARLHALARPQVAGTRPLGLLVAELKHFAPGRIGRLAVFKHLPDRPMVVDEPLMQRIARRYDDTLDRWLGDGSTHLVMAATFSVREGTLPRIRECAIVLASENWVLRPARRPEPADDETGEAPLAA